MAISKIPPNLSASKQIYIPQRLNPQKKYLYNEVMALIEEHHKPAVVHNKGIDIDLSYAGEKFIEALNKFGIKFVPKK